MQYKSCAVRGRKYINQAPRLEIRKDNLSNCLNSLADKDCLVLVIPKLIHTRSKFMREPSNTKDTEMQQELYQNNCQTLTSWWEDFHARLFPSQGSVEDSTIREAQCFLKSLGLLKKNDHAFWCLRTSKGFCLTTRGIHTLQSFPRLMNWDMTLNGKLLTARISACPKTASACSLSDILEDNPPEKYFLSKEKQMDLFKSLRRESATASEYTIQPASAQPSQETAEDLEQRQDCTN